MVRATLAGALLALAAPAADAAPPGFERVGDHDDPTLWVRADHATGVEALYATGQLDAPFQTVCAMMADVERYPEFIPGTVSAHILENTPEGLLTLQRFEAPFISPREYVVRVSAARSSSADGGARFLLSYQAAPGGPPPTDDVVRITTVRGSWTLMPLDGGKRTAAIYQLYADPGGSVPAFLVNANQRRQVPELFKQVETVAQRWPRRAGPQRAP